MSSPGRGGACVCPGGGRFALGDWGQGLTSRSAVALASIVRRNRDVPAEPIRAGMPDEATREVSPKGLPVALEPWQIWNHQGSRKRWGSWPYMESQTVTVFCSLDCVVSLGNSLHCNDRSYFLVKYPGQFMSNISLIRHSLQPGSHPLPHR